MSALLTDLWYFAAASRELRPGAMFRREILGEPVLLGRDSGGRAFAIRDICPHRAVPLSAGRMVETNGEPTVECPYHGFRFGTDGVCKLIPSLVEGQPYEAHRIRVRHFPTHEAHGIVLIYMSADPRFEGEPPPAPDFGLGDFSTPNFTVERIFPGHMDDAVARLMDPACAPNVTWWQRSPSIERDLKETRLEPHDCGWAIARHRPVSTALAARMAFGAAATADIRFLLSGFRWEVVANPRARLVTLTCLTPQNDLSTRITLASYWSNAPVLDVLKPFLIAAAREFLEQDGPPKRSPGVEQVQSMLSADAHPNWYSELRNEWAKSREEGRAFVNPIEPTRSNG